MFKHYLPIILAGCLLTACSGQESPKVASLQKKDKSLSCSEVQLEINEAEFYRKTAENNKNPNVKSLLMPLGYISTYVSADDASNAADARIDYLNRIYDILKCDDADAQAKMATRQHPYGDYQMGGAGYSQPTPNPARFAPMVAPQQYQYQSPYPPAFNPISYSAPLPQSYGYSNISYSYPQDAFYW